GFYRAALALRNQTPGVWLNLGHALLEKEDSAGANAANQNATQARSILGNPSPKREDLAGALIAYSEAVRLKHDVEEAHNILSNLNLLREKRDLAEGISTGYATIITNKGEQIELMSIGRWCELWEVYFRSNQLDMAMQLYANAIEQRPDWT